MLVALLAPPVHAGQQGVLAESEPGSASVFSDPESALWSVSADFEFVDLESGQVIWRAADLEISPGIPIQAETIVQLATGSRAFELELTAYHHVDEAVEFEYDLRISESSYKDISWFQYLLYRFRLASGPDEGPFSLSVSRADIVSVQGKAHVNRFSVSTTRYEMRLRGH